MSTRRESRHTRKSSFFTQNTFQVITALVTAGIFFSEGFVKERSLASQEIVTFASHSEVHENHISEKTDEHGAMHKERSKRIEGDTASSSVRKSQHEGTNVQVPGSAVDIQEFSKLAQEKAMADAMRKREELQRVKLENFTNPSPRPFEVVGDTALLFQGENETAELRLPHKPVSEFRGVQKTPENAHLFAVDNVTHLSFMLYRLVKTHNIASILDIPCTSSMFWMPHLLERLEFEIPNLHYRCIVPNDEGLVEGVLRFKDLSSPVVLKDEMMWASKLPRADLAFAWYGLGYMTPQRSWQLLKALRKSGTKYIIVPSFPDMVHNPAIANKHGRINIRRAPYRFNEPLRVVNNMSGLPDVRKQLFLYDLEGIRNGIL